MKRRAIKVSTEANSNVGGCCGTAQEVKENGQEPSCCGSNQIPVETTTNNRSDGSY